MDHMRISGNEPSSVILRQIVVSKKWKMLTQRCQKMLKPKVHKRIQFIHTFFQILLIEI